MGQFSTDFGIHSGRIARVGAPEGTHVYELGHALMAEANAAVGDKHEITQTYSASIGAKVVTVRARIATPRVLAEGLGWEFYAKVGSVEMYNRRIVAARRPLEITDLVFPVGVSITFGLRVIAT